MYNINPAVMLDLIKKEKIRRECERSLMSFTRHAWSIIEPAQEFKENWHLEAIAEHLEAVSSGDINMLIISVPPGCMKSILVSVAFPAWEWIKEPGLRYLGASYGIDLAIRDAQKCRDVITSDWYRGYWGEKVQIRAGDDNKLKYSLTSGGWRMATSVGGRATGEHPDRKIIDDPHNAKQAESDAERESALTWFDRTLSTRGMSRGARTILVAQRFNEQDLTGHILAEKFNGDHLCIPMEYDGNRRVTSLGWTDPRQTKGELLWPAMFNETQVADLKQRLGVYGCTPAESPVLMSDLSIKKISEIKKGDEVVGFKRRDRDDGVHGRATLTPAVVEEVFKYENAQIVKITLDSGHVIRCTKDHKWFTKMRSDSAHSVNGFHYCAAGIGSKLRRVCPPSLPVLSGDELRLAGWLAGFFDGEGTVSLGHKETHKARYKSSGQIRFFQGAGRNLPLCEKLEYALTYFGFKFRYDEDHRKDNKTAACYGYRQYTLQADSHAVLPMFQRFLHIVQPEKWRDRIIGAALGAKFIKNKEEVISIEEDGQEDVYALKTSTGNYIVWGLASSNSSGQLQQEPAPPEGGILNTKFFQLWPPANGLPPFEYVLQSYDCAFTDKTSNDPTACTVWAVFTHKGQRNVMLIDAWDEYLTYPDLRARAIMDWATEYGGADKRSPHHKARRPDRVLVEEKAAGISLIQDLRLARVPVVTYNPGGSDKIARAHQAAPTLELGIIWVPESGKNPGHPVSWANSFMKQLSKFPRTPHDDYVDTFTQAIIYLKDNQWFDLPKAKYLEDMNPRVKEQRVNPYAV